MGELERGVLGRQEIVESEPSGREGYEGRLGVKILFCDVFGILLYFIRTVHIQSTLTIKATPICFLDRQPSPTTYAS